MPNDLKRIISTFTYRIESNPQGGFIAHANDPSLPRLEAPTRQELQQKIQANIGAALAKEFPGLDLPSGNLPSGGPASGNKELKFDFHIETKPGGGFTLHSHDPNGTTIEGTSHEEIEHPFAEKLAGVVGKYFLPELSQALAKQGGSGEIKVFVDRRVGSTPKLGSQKLAFYNSQTSQPSGASHIGEVVSAGDSSPITFEKSKAWPIIRFFLTLLVIAALDVLLPSPLKPRMWNTHSISQIAWNRVGHLRAPLERHRPKPAELRSAWMGPFDSAQGRLRPAHTHARPHADCPHTGSSLHRLWLWLVSPTG